jgi:hypothetical protein
MNKNPLIGISITVACLIVLASYANVVGVQTVESSDNKVIKDEVDQKELLFQTIIDLAKNKDIQSIIQKSEIKENLEKSLQVPGAKLLMFELRLRFFMVLPPPQVLTKNYLDYAYKVSLRRLKNFDASRFNPILENLKVNNQEIQKEITAIIEKNNTLNKEIGQLSDLNCNCENDSTANWNFPIICLLLFPLVYISIGFYLMGGFGFLMTILGTIGMKLNCFW